MKTYTPGLFGVKLFALIASLIICVAGLFEVWYPTKLILGKGIAKSSVVRVEKTRSGFKTEVYTTTQPIPEDRNRSATFWQYVEFMTPEGNTMTAKLNIASRINPVYSVGSKVKIAYDKSKPDRAVAIYDMRTWTLGFFVLLIGVCFAITSLYLMIFALKPIELPEDTPDEDPGLKQIRELAAKNA